MEAPSFRDIAAALREQIASGELAPGAALPTERALAAEHRVSQATARNALTMILNEGLATGGQGRTRRVRQSRPLVVHASRMESVSRRTASGVDSWKDEVRQLGRADGMEIAIAVVPAAADIAGWLEIDPGQRVAVRRRVRTIDGQPDNLNDTYYPWDLALQFPEILDPADVPQGIIALMESRGVVQVRYTDELRWRPPLPEEAARLKIPSGVAVLAQYRTGYTTERPVKCTVTIWPGHDHVMRYEVPA